MAELAIQLAFAAAGNAVFGAGIPALGLTGAGIGFIAGGVVNSFLFPPPDVNTSGPQLSDLTVTASTYGKMRPIIYGTAPTAGDIIDASDKYKTSHTQTQESGKGGGQKVSHTTYTYSVDLAIMLCDGEIDGVLQIFANETLIYDATPGSSFLKPSWLNVKIYNGTETQHPDPTLEAIHGAGNVPGYRGQAYAVFTRYELGQSGQIPNFRFVVVGNGTPTINEIITDINPDPWTTSGAAPRDGYADGPLYISKTGLVYTSIWTGSADERALVAMDPYSRNIVWAIDGRDVSGEGIVKCLSPQRCGVGSKPYIVISGKDTNPASTQTKIFIVDAVTGYPAKVIDLASTNSSAAISLYTDSLTFICQGGGFYLNYRYHNVNLTTESDDHADIAQPDGWDFNGNSIIGVKQGNSASRAVIAIGVETGTNKGIATWTDSRSIPLSDHTPSYTVHDYGTSISEAKQIKYDSVRDCFWAYCGSPYIVLINIPLDGSSHTVYDWNTLYGHTGLAQSTTFVFGDEFANGYIWIEDTAGDLWRWDIVNLTAPVEYAGTTIDSHMTYIAVTQSMWGVSTDRVVEYQHDKLQSNTVTLASIVDDICDRVGLDPTEYETSDLDSTAVRGYVVSNQMSARAAIEPLRKGFLFDHADTGSQIQFKLIGQSLDRSLTIDDIGAHANGEQAPPVITINRTQEIDLPKEVGVNYMDVGANYEVGHQRARILQGQSNQSISIPLPIVFTHGEAAQKSEILLHLARIERQSYEVNAMPVHWDLIPTDVIAVNDGTYDYRMRVSEKVNERGVIKLRCVRDQPEVLTSTAEGAEITGRSVTIPAVGIMQYELLNIPPLRDQDMTVGFYAAGYSYTPDWPGGVIYKSTDQSTWTELIAITTPSTAGRVWNTPSTSNAEYWDNGSALLISIYTGELESKTRAEVSTGSVNAAAYGADGRWEIVQFADATLGSDGIYTVESLLRGRLGTGRHVNSHEMGDLFILLDESTVRRIEAQQAEIGSTRYYLGATIGHGIYDEINIQKEHSHIGAGMLCYAPAQFTNYTEADLDIVFGWRERTRQIWANCFSGMSSDPADYEIDILDGSTVVRTLTASAETVTYSWADQQTDFGTDTTDTATARLYQVNEIGRGNYVDLSISLGIYPNPVYKYALSLNPTNYWVMNSPGSVHTNAVAGGLDLTLYGGYTTKQTPGLDYGYSVKLNYADYGRTSTGSKQAWLDAEQTWSFLLNVGSAPTGGDAFFAVLSDTISDILMTISTSRTIKFHTQLSSTWTIIETTTALTIGQWYLITASIGADGMKLYVDGVEEASDPETDWNSGTGTTIFQIGDPPYYGGPTMGDMYIDQVMTWHGRQLTDDEVSGLAARMI